MLLPESVCKTAKNQLRWPKLYSPPLLANEPLLSPRNPVALAPLHMRRTAAVRQMRFLKRCAIRLWPWRSPDISVAHPCLDSARNLSRSPQGRSCNSFRVVLRS